MCKKNWQPDSWRDFPALQQPAYDDTETLKDVLQKIQSHPALVSHGEVKHLKNQIAAASRGERFILQGGDCAERFIDCRESIIANKIKILLQMSVILTHGLRKPIVRIGRIAGQYAKPRSKHIEIVNGLELPAYRGDIINGYEPRLEDRLPQPMRMLTAYSHSAITLNYIRAIIDGGFADLHHPHNWDLNHIEQTSKWAEYKTVVERILDAINFMESFGGLNSDRLGKIELFTSHEGLLLPYEEMLTHYVEREEAHYNLSAHMLWIGERTRNVDGAHLEYFRGVENPVGVKMGPTITEHEIERIVDILNPENEQGKLLFITRMGADNVRNVLPRLIKKVKEMGANVAWCCDPMHGNMVKLPDGVKTRRFTQILKELRETIAVHRELDSILAGAHFELTGDDVTECVGGAVNLQDADLSKNYVTYCDPRLNYSQSLEMAFAIADMMKSSSRVGA